MKIYKLVDWIHTADREALNLDKADHSLIPKVAGKIVKVGAVITGEKRLPKAGEWYISGAIPEAYKAPNDLSSSFHIARLVAYTSVTVTTDVIVRAVNKA